jgi:hypothetical protein
MAFSSSLGLVANNEGLEDLKIGNGLFSSTYSHTKDVEKVRQNWVLMI